MAEDVPEANEQGAGAAAPAVQTPEANEQGAGAAAPAQQTPEANEQRAGDAAPADIRQRFDEQLDRAMDEDEIVETLAKAHLDPALIRKGAGEKYETVCRAVLVWTTASAKLAAQLAQAQSTFETFTQSHPKRKAAIVGWSLAILGSLGVITLAVLFSPLWLFLFILVFYTLYLIMLPGEARDAKRQELRIPALTQRLEATNDRIDIELHLHVMAAVRETINAELKSYDTRYRLYDRQGLEQLADHEREISTHATERLAASMATLASGSIGLSGARGAGKTALIYSFTEGPSTLPFPRSRRGFVVSAPVRYDAREFVLHLFARLCDEVLGEAGVADMYRRRTAGLQARHRRSAALALGIAGCVLLAAGGAILLANQTAPHGPRQTGFVFIIIGGLVVTAAMGLFQWAWLQRGRGRANKPTPEWQAEENLDEIRYQQTMEAGWSGGIQLPLGLTLGAASEIGLERVVMTLPEVVDRFKRYAATLTANNYWVIGIDELDKMESEDAARRFLNDIKGVFGVKGCYYLVSVSEDAMSSFERRGLPFRDVFDSSFDAIERIRYLTMEESQRVLARRVLGLPVPFQALCHCLSGGLPRDLIRVARELVEQERQQRIEQERQQRSPEGGSSDGSSQGLAKLCSALVRADLEGKVAAAIVAARGAAPAGDRDWLLAWLCADDSASVDPSRLRRRCAEMVSWRGLHRSDDREAECVSSARDIGLGLATFIYYASTVLEFFVDSLDQLTLETIGEDGSPVVERLARARQYFSLSSVLAWREVTRFRNANQSMDSWESATDGRVAQGPAVPRG